MLRGFATISYWADDVQAAADWYAQLLGIQPYFHRDGRDGRPAYIEFRVGDHQDELGLISRAYAPPGTPTGPGGAVIYWHVDDVEAALARLLALGAAAPLDAPNEPRPDACVQIACAPPCELRFIKSQISTEITQN